MTGTVTVFIKHGYGFVRCRETKEEIFVHVLDVDNARNGKLEPGDELDFTRIESSKGPKAVAATIIRFARERRSENEPVHSAAELP